MIGIALAPTRRAERWDFDGLSWVQRGSFVLDNSIVVLRAVTDSSQRVLVQDGIALHEAAETESEVLHFGLGCGNPEPRLAARTLPRIGEPDFGLEAWARPGLPVLFALATGQGSTPLGPGCALLLQPVTATVLATADARGLAVQPIPLPPDPALRGLALYAQAGCLDPTAPSGFTMTPGLRIAIGD
jgi:hypothetical protein